MQFLLLSHYRSCPPGVKKLIKNGLAFKSVTLATRVRSSTKSPEHELITFRKCAVRFVSNIEYCSVLSIRILIIRYCNRFSRFHKVELCLYEDKFKLSQKAWSTQ